jgi:AraC-like DNA-binding protein
MKVTFNLRKAQANMKIQAVSYKNNSIFYSVRTERGVEKEQYVPDHALIHILAGKIDIMEADSRNTFICGDTFFVRRNSLAKVIKFPPDNGEPFKSLGIFIKRPFLQDYYAKNYSDVAIANHTNADVRIKKVASTPLIQGLFTSIYPYFDSGIAFNKELMEIKTREAILILMQVDSSLQHCLFNFAEPGKIDLEEFMCKKFMFNVPLETFSKMTGRSLSTFKRDFEKIFDLSPSCWLKKKRLELAHYLIKEKHKTPSDVYLEVGFENLSHFSSSFKEAYGYNPSALRDP